MATYNCEDLAFDRHTILDIANQKRTPCGLGGCDSFITSNSLKRGRYMSGAHACPIVAGDQGSVTIPVGTEVFGTTGIQQSGASVGMPWRTSMTYSDTDVQNGGAFQQSRQFLIVGLAVAPQGCCQVTDSTGMPAGIVANTEVITNALGNNNSYLDRKITEEFFNHAHFFVTTPDNECIQRLELIEMLGFNGGIRERFTMQNGGDVPLTDFTPLMVAYCAGSSYRNNPTFTVATDRPAVVANDAMLAPAATVLLNGTTSAVNLRDSGTVYCRYKLLFYGFPVILPDNVCPVA